ncbi:MAG: hypothetical protein ACETWK_06480 [Candidatus Aminicenantaceae bacterium]
MEKYTKPVVVKVPLKPEQAVLGTCKAGATTIRDSKTFGCSQLCKQKKDFKACDYNYSS